MSQHEYLLTTGRMGELGRFRSSSELARGGRAVVRTSRGLEVGASRYLTKSSFHDNTFLRAVTDLIGEA